MEPEQISRWLRNRWHIQAPQDWLTACVDWIHSENTVSVIEFLYDNYTHGVVDVTVYKVCKVIHQANQHMYKNCLKITYVF